VLTIRPEKPEDYQQIAEVNTHAFFRPDEADLVDTLRSDGKLVVSLVAVMGERVVGQIAFSPVRLDQMGKPSGAVGLGPMAVLPTHQNQGIGLELIKAGLDACRDAGYEVVVVLGHPGYYPKAGFAPASAYGISCEFDVPDEVFMALELEPGKLDHYRGAACYQPAFRSVS
jgi:putative acetyltransferase